MHSLHSYFLRPGDPHEEIRYAVDRIRDGRVVHHPPGASPGSDRKGEDVAIFALTADFHAGETAGRRARAADAGRAGAGDAALARPRSPAAHGDRAAGALAIGRAVEQRLLEDPFARRARSRRRTRRRGAWMRVAGRLPDDAGRARGGADLRQRPDAARRPGSPGSAAAGAATTSAPASTTRSGSTGRCGPTTGSSTRPTARRPPAGRALCFGQIWAADGTHVATVAQAGPHPVAEG